MITTGILALLGALAAMPADSPTVELDVPHEVRQGEPVPMTLRVTNTADRPLTLRLRGRPVAFDLVVRGADGTIVWRRLEGAMIAMVLQLRTLAPGETLELEELWHQQAADGTRVSAGEYTVSGALLTDSHSSLESPPATLRIRARPT